MLEVEEEDTERLTMTSVHNEVVNARTAMKTTKVAKLRSERATQLQLHVDAARNDEVEAGVDADVGDA
uniref:Uncharacterized protein n=1 Tax=Oryza sativa subsp. japonica TaxID=39947 RepID=Q84SR5_ORYSJ|nr:hypothetical protein [Oryza sativa Japonica Group]